MEISKLKIVIFEDLENIRSEADCGAFHAKYLGKAGAITEAMQSLRNLAAEERAKVGAEINIIKRNVEAGFFNIQKTIQEAEINRKLMADTLVDVTIPDLNKEVGSLHPITRVTREVVEIFSSMGFIVAEGNEIVTEFENFESVNVPKHHPARDMQDTFWLSNGMVLKTHTSALQNILLKKHGPVFSAVFPGRCYRNENLDASHEMAFFQVEGMMVGEDISIANLIYFLKQTLSQVLDRDLDVRLRPGYFPFTEPGFEIDISCAFCDDGCSVCKRTKWIEFGGCGMIHPTVLEMGDVDPKKYQGFAFGLGLTRLAMMKYGVNDVRVFNSGKIDALSSIK